jgi:phospholipid/cholesterol/gamma-HCH transport system substrate-binding protein
MKFELHRHRDLLAGFFVATAAITFLVGLALLFARKGLFELRYTIAAVFDSGVGMRPGADVLFNGVKIGQVESLNLLGHSAHDVSQGKVVLNLTLDRKFQEFITNRSVAFALRDKNLVSDRVVNIETQGPGGAVLKDGDTIMVSNSRDIETVLTGLTALMGKMDQLINSIDQVVVMSKDPNTTVGAMLGSRELYDRLLAGVNNVDTAVTEGRRVLGRVGSMADTLHSSLAGVLARADTASIRLVRTAEETERLGVQANVLADHGEVILRRIDQIMLQGAGKLDQAGDLMDAVSSLWFIKGKMRKQGDYPVLLIEAGP